MADAASPLESRRIDGFWRLPGHGQATPGTLTIRPNGSGELFMPTGLRAFTESGVATSDGTATTIRFTEDSLAQSSEYPRIVGVAGTTAYTLDGCIRTRSQSIFGGAAAETVLVNEVFAGVEFEKDEPATGDGLRLRVAYLEDWVHETGIAETVTFREDGEEVTDVPTFTLLGTQLPKRSTTLGDGTTLSLVHRVAMTGNRLDERAITQRFEFHVDLADTAPIEEVLDYANRLQAIVSIGTCRTATFKEVRAVHPDLLQELSNGSTIRRSFEVIANWTAQDATAGRRPMEHNMWFTFTSLGGIDAIGRWVDTAERYRTPVRRVMATAHTPTMYQSDKLLNCAAALEAFDRERTGTKRSKFRTRLNRCVTLAGPAFTDLLPDVNSWLDRARDERDDAAHQLDRFTKTTTAATHWMWRSLYLLFVLCMLHESSANATAIEGIKSNAEYRQLRNELQAAL